MHNKDNNEKENETGRRAIVRSSWNHTGSMHVRHGISDESRKNAVSQEKVNGRAEVAPLP